MAPQPDPPACLTVSKRTYASPGDVQKYHHPRASSHVPRLWADFLVSLLRTTQPKKIFLLVMATDSPLGWEEERGRRAGEPREVTQRLKTNPRYSSVSQSVVPKTPHPSPGMWVKVQILESWLQINLEPGKLPVNMLSLSLMLNELRREGLQAFLRGSDGEKRSFLKSKLGTEN